MTDIPFMKYPSADSPRVEDSPVPADEQLATLLDQVEYYQPLYGISGFEPPLRGCRDRAVTIEQAILPLGKDFRLVDFGSSLGYFPFFFADRGATVTGCDIKPQNTAVALGVQRLNRLPGTFKTAPLDLQAAQAISPGEYDVALFLSVLHHIIHRDGIEHTSQLLAELTARIPTLILELAHRQENVQFAWRESLPEDPLAILSECKEIQVRPLARFTSHLSDSTRPMFLITHK